MKFHGYRVNLSLYPPYNEGTEISFRCPGLLGLKAGPYRSQVWNWFLVRDSNLFDGFKSELSYFVLLSSRRYSRELSFLSEERRSLSVVTGFFRKCIRHVLIKEKREVGEIIIFLLEGCTTGNFTNEHAAFVIYFPAYDLPELLFSFVRIV